MVVATLFSRWGRYRLFFFWVVIFLSLLPSSFVRNAMTTDHLSGTINAFEYFFDNGFQFGKDFIDNVGPYGYLHYPSVYSGKSFYSRIIGFSAVLAVFSFLASAFLSRLKNPYARGISLLYLVYFPFQENFPMLSYELVPRLAVFLSGVFLLDSSDKLSRRPLFIAAGAISLFYAYITLQKTSNVYLIVFVLISVALHYFLNKNRLLPAVLGGSFFIFLLSLWVLAGQKISHLPDFFLSSYRFSVTYQEAASDVSTYEELIFGLVTAAIVIGSVVLRLVKSAHAGKPIFVGEVFYASVFSASVFTAWKHGMSGTGIHTGIYFNFAACVAPYLFFHRADELKMDKPIFQALKFANPSNIGLAGFSTVVLLSFLLIQDLKRPNPIDIFSEIYSRLHTLANYDFEAKKKDLDADIAALQKKYRMPDKIKSYVGDAKVDEYGDNPQALLINNMNYRPRPVPINYIVQNRIFMELNRRYYADSRTAPEFVFADEYLFQDFKSYGPITSDSGAFIELLLNYKPFESYKKWEILKKADSSIATGYSLVGERISKFNHIINDVPYSGKELYWCKIEVHYNLLGRIVKFLFKPPKISVELYTEGGGRYERSITPPAAEYGFLVNPLITNFLSYTADAPLKRIITIRVKHRQSISGRLFKDNVKFTFYKIRQVAQR